MNKNNILNREYLRQEYILKHDPSSRNRNIYSSFFNKQRTPEKINTSTSDGDKCFYIASKDIRL